MMRRSLAQCLTEGRQSHHCDSPTGPMPSVLFIVVTAMYLSLITAIRILMVLHHEYDNFPRDCTSAYMCFGLRVLK